MLRLTRRKSSRSWYISGTVAGQRIFESTGETDRSRAEEICARRADELHRARVFGRESVATFAEAVNLYLDTGGSPRFLAPLVKRMGQTRLVNIDARKVAAVAQSLYPDRSPATINRQVYTPVVAVMRCAAEAGLCKPLTLRRPKQTRPERRHVSPEWMRRVCEKAPPGLAALLLTGAMTGARRGELLRLTWGDVDLRAGVALIRRTKTGVPRRVALADPVVAAMANIPGKRNDEAPVFGYPGPRRIYEHLRIACAAAGVEYVPFHQSGRHTFVSWLLAQGVSLKMAAEAAGMSHKMAAEVYGHLEHSAVDAAVRGLAENWKKAEGE